MKNIMLLISNLLLLALATPSAHAGEVLVRFNRMLEVPANQSLDTLRKTLTAASGDVACSIVVSTPPLKQAYFEPGRRLILRHESGKSDSWDLVDAKTNTMAAFIVCRLYNAPLGDEVTIKALKDLFDIEPIDAIKRFPVSYEVEVDPSPASETTAI